MKLITLLEHCGQLLNIIYKNHMPSDRLASKYFRSKKYIGSKERKFIADTIFNTLRNIYCLKKINNTLENKELKYVSKINNCFQNNKNNFISIALVQILIAENFPNKSLYFDVNALLKKINSAHNSITESLAYDLKNLEVKPEEVKSYTDEILTITNNLFNNRIF